MFSQNNGQLYMTNIIFQDIWSKTYWTDVRGDDKWVTLK